MTLARRCILSIVVLSTSFLFLNSSAVSSYAVSGESVWNQRIEYCKDVLGDDYSDFNPLVMCLIIGESAALGDSTCMVIRRDTPENDRAFQLKKDNWKGELGISHRVFYALGWGHAITADDFLKLYGAIDLFADLLPESLHQLVPILNGDDLFEFLASEGYAQGTFRIYGPPEGRIELRIPSVDDPDNFANWYSWIVSLENARIMHSIVKAFLLGLGE